MRASTLMTVPAAARYCNMQRLMRILLLRDSILAANTARPLKPKLKEGGPVRSAALLI